MPDTGRALGPVPNTTVPLTTIPDDRPGGSAPGLRSPFGIRIPPCASLADTVRCVQRAERAGYGTVWVPDSQFLFRDAWMALGASAVATEHIRLAIGVTNLRTRHPSVTASAMQTLEEAAPGRTAIGLGTGDSSVKSLGWSASRLADVEAGMDGLRRLSLGRTVTYHEWSMRLRDATGRVPPLFLAATGPRALRLAGRVADGVLIMAGVTPSLVGLALQHVEEGLAEAGRSRSEIEVCLGAVCHVADDDTDVVRVARPHCVGDAQRGASPVFAQVGVRLRAAVPAHIPDVYPDITHAEDWDQAAGVASRWVDDTSAQRYAQAFTLIGTPDELTGRLQAAMAAGVDSFYLRHYQSYVLPVDLLDRFATVVAPGVVDGPDAGRVRSVAAHGRER